MKYGPGQEGSIRHRDIPISDGTSDTGNPRLPPLTYARSISRMVGSMNTGHGSQRTFGRMVRDGDPVEQILSAADEVEADLIVMPTAGRAGAVERSEDRFDRARSRSASAPHERSETWLRAFQRSRVERASVSGFGGEAPASARARRSASRTERTRGQRASHTNAARLGCVRFRGAESSE